MADIYFMLKLIGIGFVALVVLVACICILINFIKERKNND